MPKLIFETIGVIRSPFSDTKGMPIQPQAAVGVRGSVELDPRFAEGLRDLDGFSHITLLYHFHRSKPHSLLVKPFLDNTLRGVFATRVPSRPSSIGISTVRLIGIEGTTILIEEVDILDGTPVLDIKPFIPSFDNRETDRIGWFAERASRVSEVRADRRFAEFSDESPIQK